MSKKLVIKKKKSKPKKRRKRKKKSYGKLSKQYQKPMFRKRIQRAIEGSGGIMAKIAQNLKMSYSRAYHIIKNGPEWVQEAMEIERQQLGDIAEMTVRDVMLQRLDLGAAGRTSMQVLKSKKFRDRGYAPEKNLTVQGGVEPIKIQSQNLVSIEHIKTIPLEVRKKMLEEMEDEEDE